MNKTSFLEESLDLVGRILVIISLVLVYIVVIGYMFISIPMGDDYWRATTHTITEALPLTLDVYDKWCGRWASMFLQYSMWGGLGFKKELFFIEYRISIMMIAAISFIAICWMIRLMTNKDWAKVLPWAALFIGTYLSSYHSLGESVYWFPGAAEGGLASICVGMVFWLTVMKGNKNVPELVSKKYLLVVCFFSFVAPGLHEIAGLFLCAFFSLILIFMFLFGLPFRGKYILISFIITLIATSVSVFAPGNAIRAGIEFSNADVSLSGSINALVQLWLRVGRVIFSPAFIVGSIIVILFSNKFKIFYYFPFPPKKSALISFLGFVALVGLSLLIAWKTSKIPAGRTVNFFATVFILCCLPLILYVFSTSIHNLLPKIIFKPLLFPLNIIFAFTIFLGSTLDRGLFSYKTNLLPWVKYQNDKHFTLCKSPPHSEIFLKPAPPAPPLLFIEHDLKNSNSISNLAQERYYALKSIRILEVSQ